MVMAVTAAMLYDLVACPHRVTMDLFADPAQRDEPNPFVQLLWEKGSLYERDVDLPAFFGPVITGEQRQLKFVVRLRVLPGQREPALPTSAFRHPSQP